MISNQNKVFMNKNRLRFIFFSAVGAALLADILFSAFCAFKRKLPKPQHIVVVIEENHGYDQIIGSANAPYINKLAKEGTLFTNSHSVTHPSQPNYLAFFSGSTQNVDGDACLTERTPLTTSNLGAALIKAGYSFKGYSETLPNTGSAACFFQVKNGYDYARKHAPWVNWQGDKENGLPVSSNQPFSNFPKDFNQLPTVSFVIPNEGNDMHNIDLDGDTATVKRADHWLRMNLSSYVRWAKKNNSLLIITFDEDEKGDMHHNHIVTIFVGPMVHQRQNSDSISHYNILRTIEGMYNLPHSGDAIVSEITNSWK
jgi:phospholipase C